MQQTAATAPAAITATMGNSSSADTGAPVGESVTMTGAVAETCDAVGTAMVDRAEVSWVVVCSTDVFAELMCATNAEASFARVVAAVSAAAVSACVTVAEYETTTPERRPAVAELLTQQPDLYAGGEVVLS